MRAVPAAGGSGPCGAVVTADWTENGWLVREASRGMSKPPQEGQAMNTLRTLVARCREAGIELTPSADGRLQVRAPAPLPEELLTILRQYQVAILTVLTCHPLLPCPACGSGAWLEPLKDPDPQGRCWACMHCGVRIVIVGRVIVWAGPDGVMGQALRETRGG